MTPRFATTEDIPAIVVIHRLAFFTAMPHMPDLHTPEETAAFHAEVVFRDCQVWVTGQPGQVTGFIAFRPGWIEQLYIHPDHQGEGHGSTLLKVATDTMASLKLWTFQCNTRARRFYEARGFGMIKETDGAENEERQPDVLYGWSR